METESEDEVDLIEPVIVPENVSIGASVLSKMKVTDIRAHLKIRSIVAKGNKEDMLAQLKKALVDNIQSYKEEISEEGQLYCIGIPQLCILEGIGTPRKYYRGARQF